MKIIKELFCKKCGEKVGQFSFDDEKLKDAELEVLCKECK